MYPWLQDYTQLQKEPKCRNGAKLSPTAGKARRTRLSNSQEMASKKALPSAVSP